MNRFIFLLIVLAGCSSMASLQRSRLITAFHLIEDKKYEEAKSFIENMVEDEEAAEWPRTWHARGLLYQNAYREGKEKNNQNLYEMQPRQLFVAYESYEKALSLDAGNRIRNLLAPRYVLLANDFQVIGLEKFRDGEYLEALEAFETVSQIRKSDLLRLETDTVLIYNMALAAIEGRNHDKAIEYLSRLDQYQYGTNVSHLLFTEFMELGDTLNARRVLEEGIDRYDDNENLVLLLADLNHSQGLTDEALTLLEQKSTTYPSNYQFPYTKGLILQKTGNYKKAIKAYEKSLELEPENPIIYANIATCYFNIGVEIEEHIRLINYNTLMQEERERSTAALESATKWIDKALELDNMDAEALSIIRELSALLEITVRVESSNGQPAQD